MELLFTYFKCGTCTAHQHCEECAGEIRTSLLQTGSFSDIALELSYERGHMVCGCSLDKDDALDFLETLGIFEL